MFATIRRYTTKNLTNPKDAFAGLKQRLEQKFINTLQDIPGFHCYYVLTPNDRELVTISIFDSHTGTQESTRRAAEFIKADPMKDQLSTPEVQESELLLSKEALVGTH